eukprot:CAMPEP_0182447866 /NCGR_PEP_ID=MMETSP1172-20130603/21052_1 /TAXON_ID=708627 /ORGANISM="Timspurckia oligopyrenoides, Strain CCMP3278" /LENGTH=276 /DNA_ID=CAMNT_0024644489 /DNA_START=409 /DNA_END=1239 /DNA_ORIENTATION=+
MKNIDRLSDSISFITSSSKSKESSLRSLSLSSSVSQESNNYMRLSDCAFSEISSTVSTPSEDTELTIIEHCIQAFGAVEMCESGVELHSLSAALESFIPIFDCVLPGGAAGWVRDKAKKDFRMNLGKLREAMGYLNVKTTEELFDAEEKGSGETLGCEGLLWMKRNLQMILLLVRFLWEDYKEHGKVTRKVRDHLGESYKQTLKGCYNWIGRKGFSMGLRFAPDDVQSFAMNLGYDSEKNFLESSSELLKISGRALNPVIIAMNERRIEIFSKEII